MTAGSQWGDAHASLVHTTSGPCLQREATKAVKAGRIKGLDPIDISGFFSLAPCTYVHRLYPSLGPLIPSTRVAVGQRCGWSRPGARVFLNLPPWLVTTHYQSSLEQPLNCGTRATASGRLGGPACDQSRSEGKHDGPEFGVVFDRGLLFSPSTQTLLLAPL